MTPVPEAMPHPPDSPGHAHPASRLRRALAAFDAWYRPVGVPERLAALRLLIGGFAAVYVTARLPNLLGLSELGGFRGVGVTSLLSAALPAWVAKGQALLAAVLGLAFFLGYRFRFTGPAFALALLWVMTYRNSFGMVFHTENLLVTHVLVLGCSRAADAWSLDARRGPAPVPSRSHGWPVQLLALLTVAGYLLAGIAKLRLSGLSWAASDLLRNYIAYDNLRKLMLADTYSPIGAWLVGYPALFPPLAFASLAMELLAPLALLGRRAAAVWSLAAWSFHLGVLAIMAIFFPYPLFGLAFAPFFAVERLFLFRRLRRNDRRAAVPRGPAGPG